jgi:hypothetical protein
MLVESHVEAAAATHATGQGTAGQGHASDATRSLSVAERKAAAEKASIISREQRQAGSVGVGAYAAYTEGMGGVAVALGVLLLMAAAQVAAIFTNLWLSQWVKLPYGEQQRGRPVVHYLVLGE